MALPSRNFLRFALVSGVGWLIDVGTTMSLVEVGAYPFWASLIGAATAVTFVYFVSLRSIFEVNQRFRARGFPSYVLWQICAIIGASALIAILADLFAPVIAVVLDRLVSEDVINPMTWAAGAAKALVTPLTLLANFLFMKWLTFRLKNGR